VRQLLPDVPVGKQTQYDIYTSNMVPHQQSFHTKWYLHTYTISSS